MLPIAEEFTMLSQDNLIPIKCSSLTNIRQAQVIPGSWRHDSEPYLETLRAAIRNLSLLDRLLVALHFGAGLSHREISVELAIPSATICHRLQRSINTLRSILTQTGFQN